MAMPSFEILICRMSKSEKRQRTERVIFRLTSEERRDFEERCLASGISKSDMFRKCCLDAKPLRKRKSRSVDGQILLKSLGQLGKVGSNLNQITKTYNMGYLPANDDLNQTLVELRETMTEIRKAVGYDH